MLLIVFRYEVGKIAANSSVEWRAMGDILRSAETWMLKYYSFEAADKSGKHIEGPGKLAYHPR